jgi:PKD repeat protein
MKTTYIKKVVFILFLLTNSFIYAQYNGGSSDGFSSSSIINTSCLYPIQFVAYNGGNGSLTTVNSLTNTTCAIPTQFFAYNGGNGDGFASQTINATVCANPSQFYAYFGGNGDGFANQTIDAISCPNPSQFYAYFGGNADGFSVGNTAPVCPTEPPVADFTASATTICVGESVTFTDTSTNLPSAWTWTFTGGTPNSSSVQNPVIVYNTPGTYAVTLLAANFNGNDTEIKTAFITVNAIPTVTSTTPAARCDSGTVTLQATASSGASLNWYAAVTGGTALASGTSFTTPSLTATTTFYVEAQFGTCTSARTAVIATVNTTPTITSTTPAQRCGTGSVTLQSTASSGTIQWFANATGGSSLFNGANYTTPSLTTTTSYFVQVSQNGCVSPRTEVIATINTIPTITGTTPASRCDAGTVTLQATASLGTLSWYATATGGTALATGTSFTTPSISATTTYYVEAATATCNSVRTAVTATVNITPSITSTTPASRCDAGIVTLSATSSAGNVVWYATATGGTALTTTNSFTTPSLSTTTSYYVEAVNGSCVTGTRTEVIATINNSPTVTATNPTTICSGDTFTISATASSGVLNWYNAPTGGTLLTTGTSYSAPLSSTFTYYVQAVDGSCSSSRIPVEVTVTNRPTNTSSTPASRCGNGSVTLAVTFTSGTINWYDAPTGGTLVGTGASFTTPSLSATTTYYAEATNGSCTSLTRTAVTATVNEQPTITSTTPASRCGNGSLTLQATGSIGTINWYNAPTGGTLVATGSSFTTPVLSTTTIYYVEVVNGTCISARTAVNATIYVVATITSTTPASRCDAGSLTLIASSNIGTLTWYDAPTGGTIVATGTSFITPSIATSTTYYVEATNGDCTSTRVAVTASIVPTAAPTGFANQTFCAGETVELIVVNGSNVVWYDASSGGNVIPTGTALVSGTTYYASQTVNGCESPTRLSITMTEGNCLGNDSFDFNQIIVYPNPVSDILTISSTQELSSIEVIDLLGRTLFRKTNSNIETQIDMSSLPTATYLVQVKVDSQVKTYKIIKK